MCVCLRMGESFFSTPDKNKANEADGGCEKSKIIVYVFRVGWFGIRLPQWQSELGETVYGTPMPLSHSPKHFILQFHYRRVVSGHFGGFFITLAPKNFASWAFSVVLAHLCMYTFSSNEADCHLSSPGPLTSYSLHRCTNACAILR